MDLIERVRVVASASGETQSFDAVTPDQIAYVESLLDIEIPHMLKRCYLEIGNGGFGPGYGIIGLPLGHESSWGDLVATVTELRRIEDCTVSLLPIIDFGCAQIMCVDCDDDEIIVNCLEGDFHYEEYTLTQLLERWCDGEIPNLHTGLFERR